MYEYYQISAQELGKNARIPLLKLGDSGEVFYELALEMVETIKRHNAEGRPTVFICPVGPVGQYPIFVRMVNRDRVSLKNCWFLNMDEYLTDEGEWVEKSHRLSFRGFMDRAVYTQVDPELLMPEAQRVFPDPHDPENLQRVIAAVGGVDIAFGGIGINGHLAFNEAQDELSPEQFKALHTRVLKITPETRTANAIGDFCGRLDDMPHWCVTIGMHEIYHARKIRLGCFRDWHRSVVRHAAYGDISAHFPATLLQEHPDVLLRFTEFVANLPD